MFGGKKVSHILPYDPPQQSEAVAAQFFENRKRISISGVQEKLSLILEKNQLMIRSIPACMWLIQILPWTRACVKVILEASLLRKMYMPERLILLNWANELESLKAELKNCLVLF